MRKLHHHRNNPPPPTNPHQHQCHSCNLPLITVIMMINNTNSLSSLAPGRRMETKARLRHLKNWHPRSNQRLLMQFPVGMGQRCLPDVLRWALLRCDVPSYDSKSAWLMLLDFMTSALFANVLPDERLGRVSLPDGVNLNGVEWKKIEVK